MARNCKLLGTEQAFRLNLVEGIWQYCQSIGLLTPRADKPETCLPLYRDLDYKSLVSELLALCDRLPFPQGIDSESVLRERISSNLGRCVIHHLQELPVDNVTCIVQTAYRASKVQEEVSK